MVRAVVHDPVKRNERAALDAAFDALRDARCTGEGLLAAALGGPLAGEVACVSSFGTESVLLLAMVAAVDPATPVLFLETARHFPETLRYRDTVARVLGLSDIRDLMPDPAEERASDPTGQLWYFDPDACCGLRKVRPLASGLAPFRAWITGRKRYQGASRAALAPVERTDGRIKLNPLAEWSADAIAREIARRGLPAHPLAAEGYRSIGCEPCTRPVGPDTDPRAGRWQGRAKTECGIHAAM